MNERKKHPFDEAPFDLIEYEHEGRTVRKSFDEFMETPLPVRVALLLDQQPKFYKGGRAIPRAEALALV